MWKWPWLCGINSGKNTRAVRSGPHHPCRPWALSRDPSDREIEVLLGLLNEQSERLKSDSSIAKSLLLRLPRLKSPRNWKPTKWVPGSSWPMPAQSRRNHYQRMNTHPVDQYLRTLTRRQLFQRVGLGVGGFALANLLNNDLSAAPKNPFSHFAPKAKNVIYFHLVGHLPI